METSKIKILLVEDDTSMGFLLVDFLESKGFDVKLYRDGDSGLKAFKSGNYDFCILDIMLPGIDGFQIAERIRADNKTIPIIFLTARSIKQDRIKGFQLGVDDYICKPFDEDELFYRIQAILNRCQSSGSTNSSIFKIGNYLFDFKNLTLQINTDKIRLTQTECDVLRILCQQMNNVVRRDDILLAIWGNTDYFNGRSLDVFITKLRKYLKEDENVRIESIPKVGFLLHG